MSHHPILDREIYLVSFHPPTHHPPPRTSEHIHEQAGERSKEMEIMHATNDDHMHEIVNGMCAFKVYLIPHNIKWR